MVDFDVNLMNRYELIMVLTGMTNIAHAGILDSFMF